MAGTVADQATKEKVLLCCGNVHGVAGVNDLLIVNAPAAEAQWHTVVSGDNLSKIAKKFYGDANKYPVIFEANKPMLSHPDKIYPGQMLRIPRGLIRLAPRRASAQRRCRPCSAFTAPAPIAAPKRLASRSATFSWGV